MLYTSDFRHPVFVLSGTSLELTSMLEVARRRQEDVSFVVKGELVCPSLELYKQFPYVWQTDDFLRLLHDQCLEAYADDFFHSIYNQLTESDFPLGLMSSRDYPRNWPKEFEDGHNLVDKAFDPHLMQFKEEVILYSLPLQGRYRWSVIYIEELFKSWLRYENILSLKAIQDASKYAVHVAKKGLREQLEKIRLKNHFYLLEDLCKTAIYADLLNRPTLFEDKNTGAWITEAFANIKASDGDSYENCAIELAERLAIDAAVEYFKSIESGLYEKYMNRFLYEHQHDHGSFGKVAEYYLAWVSGKERSHLPKV